MASATRQAGALINRAADSLEGDKNAQQALALTTRALTLLSTADGRSARLYAGRAHQVQAESYLALDRLDDAIAAYAKAEDELKEFAEDHVRCLHDAAITFANLGLDDLARHYISIGVAVSVQLPGPYHDDFVRLQLQLEVYDAASYRDYVGRVRAGLVQARDARTSAALQHRLIGAICEFGAPDEIRTVFPIFEALYRDSTTLERQITVLSPLAFLARELVPVPDTLVNAIEDVVSRLDLTVETEVQAEAYLAYAVAVWSRGRIEEAVEAALESAALYTASVWHVGSSVVRMMTGDHRSTARHIALLLACEIEDGALAAELIESARLPALPDPSTPSQKIAYLDPSGTTDVVHRPLGPLRPIVVAGRSRIAQHYPPNVPVGDPIDLDATIDAVGGPKSWWWGAWLGAGGYRFWAVRTPSGEYECGGQGNEQGSLLLRRALDMTPIADVDAAMHGAFSATYRGEEELSVELGQLLVPAPLRVAAGAAAEHGSHLSLVLASNYLSMLPVVMLGVGAVRNGRPVRLLEVATIRMAPPAALLAELGAIGRRDLPYPVGIVCRDYSDELEFTGLPNVGRVLSGPRFCARHPDADLATPDNLISALRALSDPRSVFAYCGHAGQGKIGQDLESHIPLVNGRLTAEAIFIGHTDGERIPFPERVLLAACNSAGSSGAGSGEWLGLTAATLCVGAREVIATAWPIWDLPVTQELDAALLNVLRNEEDIAAGLRMIQLDYLDQWRASESDYSQDRIPHDAREPFPLVWAAYNYFGKPPSN